jgi:hypothetical protein
MKTVGNQTKHMLNKVLISPVKKTFSTKSINNNKNNSSTGSCNNSTTTTQQEQSVKLTLETKIFEENTNTSNSNVIGGESSSSNHSSSSSSTGESKRSSSDFTYGREHLIRQPGYERYYGQYAKEIVIADMSSKYVGMRGDVINLSLGKDKLLGSNASRVNNFFKTRIVPWAGSNTTSHAIRPPNHLYIYGPKGVGSYTSVLVNCYENNINMIFVHSTCKVAGMMTKIYDRARDLQPCVVFFDHANGLISTTPKSNHTAVRYHNYFGEWWHVINHQSNAHFNNARVWTIMSGSGDPLKLQSSYRNLLKTRGAVALINVPDAESREQFFFTFGQSIMNSQTVPDPDDDDWVTVSKNFARISYVCTYKEMQTYLIQLFAECKKELFS